MNNGNGKVLLVGWKEIAKFLSCSDKTARKFHKERGLPLHKVQSGGVYAIIEDVIGWLRKQPPPGRHSN